MNRIMDHSFQQIFILPELQNISDQGWAVLIFYITTFDCTLKYGVTGGGFELGQLPQLPYFMQRQTFYSILLPHNIKTKMSG